MSTTIVAPWSDGDDQWPSPAVALARVELLGGFHATVAGRAVSPGAWRLRKAQTLVKLLALAPGHRLARERARDLLWPDLPAEAAANNLRGALCAARRALGPAAIADRGGVLALEGVGVDVAAFEAALAAARRSTDPADGWAALALYGGDLLPEEADADWLAGRREGLRRAHLTLLERLVGLEERAGRPAGALAALERLVAAEPTHEAAQRELMSRYARAGRRGEALRQYERLRAALRRELDAEPEDATRRLVRALVATGSPVLSVATGRAVANGLLTAR
jgi:DNA-binding SARP family transcriptional activator